MKTVFISILQGVEAKNILRTDIYKTLISKPDVRLVFFVGSKDKVEYYSKEFFNDRIIYEVIPTFRVTVGERIFSFLKFKLINTETMDLRRYMAIHDSRFHFIYFPISYIFNRIFARSVIRKFIRWCDMRFVHNDMFKLIFDKYKPDAVFLAHLFDDIEVAILKEAKRRKVFSFGFINSWDKLTARCMMRALPNKLFVYNNLVKEEARSLGDMKLSDIIVVGIPHYDFYFKEKASSKESLSKHYGIDTSKEILLYSPIGKYFSNSDWEIIDLIHDYINNGLLIKQAELLVRFQPNDFIDDKEIERRPWLKYCWPGVRFSNKRGVDWDMSNSDLKHLHDTLKNISILICYAASISVDAAVFDKPVININFEVKKKQEFSKTPTYFYKMSHYQKALKTGGIRLVKNKEELLFWLNKYLSDPSIDKDNRKKLVEQQCYFLDGRAGERIGLNIFSLI